MFYLRSLNQTFIMIKISSTLLLLLIPLFLIAQSPLEIWEIQGESHFSPFVNQQVTSNNNIVTAIGDDFFFMQTPTERTDNNISTSDGIMVYYNDVNLLQVGNVVSVTGTIKETDDKTQFDDTGIEVTIETNSVELPAPFLLDENFPSENAITLRDLEKVEGMYVELEATTTAATNQFDETTIKVGTKRSFREPGIRFPAPNGLPEWDGNPEVFEFDPDGLGLNNQTELAAGMTIKAKGVINYAYNDYQIYPTEYEIIGSPPLRGVDTPNNNEVTIASLNCYVLDNSSGDLDFRLAKIAKYIVELMQAPDILAVQEVRNLAVLQALANAINSIDPNIVYTPHLISSGQSGSFVIEVGYLTRSSVSNISVSQLGAEENFSQGGNLHFRTPLLLEAEFQTNTTIPIKILNLHLKSLGGITSSTNQLRRHEQAVSVAYMVENMIDDNLIVIGDLNAFQFSDGYVDVINQISGTPSLGAIIPPLDIVSAPLINQMDFLPEAEQYSYVFQGHAQILDHCLTTNLNGVASTKLQFVRANADNPESFDSDASNPWRVSDHDGFVFFLDLGAPVSIENQLSNVSFQVNYPNPFLKQSQIKLDLEEANEFQMELIQVDGRVVFQKDLGQLMEGEHLIDLPNAFPNGMYFLKIKSQKNTFVGKLLSH